MTETKGRATAATHPLDPLTAEEISSAVEILRKERDLGEKVRFAGIVVNEPPKEQVLSFNLGDDFEREALVVLVDGEEEAAYEAVVSLGEGMVESWERIEGDVQPPIVLEEFDECEEACKRNP